jgi:sulfate transport system permease protein
MLLKKRGVLPGFGLSLGYTLTYLSLIVLIPLSTIFWRSSELGWSKFWKVVLTPQVIAAFKLTFGASFAAALINAVFGLLVAWVLVRYNFPGRRLVDAFVDLPFALPTAVGGIALATIYGQNGWLGQYFYKLGIKTSLSPLGVTIALTFIGLPFVVRTVQPVLQELGSEWEEAAATLGASRLQTFRRVILPHIAPALLTGISLAFARAVGEYGSVIFISGNLPGKTQIIPQLIAIKLDEFDYPGATAIATVMLLVSFGLLLLINALQWYTTRRGEA